MPVVEVGFAELGHAGSRKVNGHDTKPISHGAVK